MTQDVSCRFCQEHFVDVQKYLTQLKEKAITAFVELNIGDISETLREMKELSSNLESEKASKVSITSTTLSALKEVYCSWTLHVSCPILFMLQIIDRQYKFPRHVGWALL